LSTGDDDVDVGEDPVRAGDGTRDDGREGAAVAVVENETARPRSDCAVAPELTAGNESHLSDFDSRLSLVGEDFDPFDARGVL
jgi:hypothetical protein